MDTTNDLHIDVLNKEWKKLSEIIGDQKLSNMIPIIDMSFLSKQSDSYYTAIGLAILVAERGLNRILVIDNQLTWVNIEQETSFINAVKKIREDTTSRIHTVAETDKVIKTLVEYIDESKLPNTKIKELRFVYFLTDSKNENFHQEVIALFYNGGLTGTRNMAFPCPKMIYWNLSQTSGSLPCSVKSKNSILLSGHSANLIRNLYIKNTDSYEIISAILKEYSHPYYVC